VCVCVCVCVCARARVRRACVCARARVCVYFFRHAFLYETHLYTYNLYGTSVAVGFSLVCEKNSNPI
jgi:hypothetical protein